MLCSGPHQPPLPQELLHELAAKCGVAGCPGKVIQPALPYQSGEQIGGTLLAFGKSPGFTSCLAYLDPILQPDLMHLFFIVFRQYHTQHLCPMAFEIPVQKAFLDCPFDSCIDSIAYPKTILLSYSNIIYKS